MMWAGDRYRPKETGMKTCNRGICAVLLLLVVVGCASDPGGPAIAVRDVGLQSALVPPLGDGVPPIGGAGGDGAAVVTRVGGWSGGPGAVQWHGGQWVVPYSARPGATLLNASCDVTPRPDATTLVELVSSSGQVLGSTAIPATTANVVIRAWILTSHTVVDGEQVVMRLSPRDSTTGAWTSTGQDVTVIGCAVNAPGGPPGVAAVSPMKLSGAAFQAVSFINYSASGAEILPTQTAFASVPLLDGATITGIRAFVRDSATKCQVSFVSVASSSGATATIGTSQVSLGNGTNQTLTVSMTSTTIAPGVFYSLAVAALGSTGSLCTVYGAEIDTL